MKMNCEWTPVEPGAVAEEKPAQEEKAVEAGKVTPWVVGGRYRMKSTSPYRGHGDAILANVAAKQYCMISFSSGNRMWDSLPQEQLQEHLNIHYDYTGGKVK